jgi:hypothetical protein
MRFFTVDYFSDLPFAGNPHAVCLLDSGWPQDEWRRPCDGQAPQPVLYCRWIAAASPVRPIRRLRRPGPVPSSRRRWSSCRGDDAVFVGEHDCGGAMAAGPGKSQPTVSYGWLRRILHAGRDFVIFSLLF